MATNEWTQIKNDENHTNKLANEDATNEETSDLPKVNGDHLVQHGTFQNEDSCCSSSSSSHNLVIDHPDEISSGLEESDEVSGKHHGKGNMPTTAKSLKRKLEGDGYYPELKHPHISNEAVRQSPKIFPAGNKVPYEEGNESTRKDVQRCATNEDSKSGVEGEGHFQEYAQYLGLKPAVKYKCFKCYNSQFETLSDLRNHQKMCLFRDNYRNFPQETIPASVFSSSSNPSIDSTFNKSTQIQTQMQSLLERQHLSTKTTAKAKKKVFLCAACGTYYENWNLFLHMREVHKRHICLYCIGMFPTAERLTLHLEMKHDLEQNHFECQEKLLRSSRDACYLMCCICEHLFTEHEDFSDHNCNDLIVPCQLCGQKGRHNSNCKSLQSTKTTKRKEKQRKRSKPSKDNNLPEKKADLPSTVTAIMSGSPRLDSPESVCDKIKAKNDNRTHWNFKVNGCVGDSGTTRSSTKTPEMALSEKPSVDFNVGTGSQQTVKDPCSYIIGTTNKAPEKTLDDRVLAGDIGDSNINTSQNCVAMELENFPPSNSHVANILEERSEYTNGIRKKNSSEFEMDTSDAMEVEESIITKTGEGEKPLLVPKFKIKVPKEFQKLIESEHSTTESDDEEIEQANKMNFSEDEKQGMGLSVSNNEKPAEEVYNNLDNQAPGEVEDKQEENADENAIDLKPTKVEMGETITGEDKTESSPDKIIIANEDVQVIELSLDRPIDKIPMKDFLRICIRAGYPVCLYCNHARRIAVNGHSLALHLLEHHRFSATVDSITAEELLPSTIISKIKSFLPDLTDIYLNLDSYCSSAKEEFKIMYEKIFECFLCRFETRIHKELYLHNRKMHVKAAIFCFMCRANFFSFSEVLCHMCPGKANKCIIFDVKYRCYLCDLDRIPSAFRLMVHLRKKHFVCDVCLEDCHDQSRLSSHVWKHKLHHLCYRCGIAYRNKPDITKHLFWKHGTESILCKRCLQKRWPHVYHFCIPPSSFVCEICNLAFSKAMFLKVHKRLHTGDAPYPCTEDNCDKKFISRKLLLKHYARHREEVEVKLVENVKKERGESDRSTYEGMQEEVKSEDNSEKDNEQNKKKRKKIKKEQKQNIDDLMDLPAPNLSESDSSDETESDKFKVTEIRSPKIPKLMLSPPSDAGEEEKEENPPPVVDIWDNFKSFQASQVKRNDYDSEESDVPPTPILHVSQSDHDYCMMYKVLSNDAKATGCEKTSDLSEDLEKQLHNSDASENLPSPRKKQKSSQKPEKSGSDSSTSGTTSGSGSTCSCASNCSCSSSAGSSSDSSSSSEESDSSTSEGRRRIAAKRAAKEARRRNKSDNSSKTNVSDVVDVVNPDVKPQDINFDSIILESDLETEESDTDEDFYDEHPQKLASQMLAEKRKQLMMQTCLSPSHNFDIVENSRPSTPSLPEEMVKEKKVKIKKKKRDKKGSKNNMLPTFKLNIPNILGTITTETIPAQEPLMSTADAMSNSFVTTTAAIETPVLPPIPLQVPATIPSSSIPAPITLKNRLSTGSSSDADAPLKRSKRTRRPNRFYGYSSDDDSMAPHATGPAAFKPTPPPNLTWRKEDLPTPSKSLLNKQSTKLPASTLKKSTPANTPPLPPIPPIIIRPLGAQPTKPVTDHFVQRPPIVEPVRVPPVPVHHIQPPQYCPSGRESVESESSDEERLHIPMPSYNAHKQAHNLTLTSIPKVNPPAPAHTTVTRNIPPALRPNPDFALLQYFRKNNIRYPIQPPAGARPPREGESVYCYCRCPYDEVSEMIACDGDDCMIEWFHFECVGIMVAPKGKWFCPECRSKYPNVIPDSSEGT